MGVLMKAVNVNLGRDGAVARSGTTAAEYSAMAVPRGFYTDIDGYAIETRDTEFGKIVEPIPLRVLKQGPLTMTPHYLDAGVPPQPLNGTVSSHNNGFSTVHALLNPKDIKQKDERICDSVRPPPKKKWIKEYLEEEFPSPVSVTLVTSVPLPLPPSRGDGAVVPRASTPVSVHALHAHAPAAALATPLPSHQPDFIFEHSRPRSNSHGPSIPSPSSSCSGSGASTRDSAGSSALGVRAGTREVHNKLEKNRRAHLKECFELLKRQLPATNDDKKASNLSILGSANRYIQVLRRKERECEHEMERLAREKIAAQQRLAALKREISIRHNHTLRVSEPSPTEERDREERINGHLLGIPISITSTTVGNSAACSAPSSIISSAELHTLPVQITSSNVGQGLVRASYGARHNTFTLTTLTTTADCTPQSTPIHQNGRPGENGLSPTLGTALVHPAHLHLPLSQRQVVRSGLVVGGTALQLVTGPAGALRILNTSQHLVSSPTTGGAAARLPLENGIVSSSPSTEANGTGSAGSGSNSVVVSGLTPLVVSQAQAHLLHTHSFTHKMMETQVVSAQYLSTATLMKPVVVVSTSAPQPTTSTAPVLPSTSRT